MASTAPATEKLGARRRHPAPGPEYRADIIDNLKFCNIYDTEGYFVGGARRMQGSRAGASRPTTRTGRQAQLKTRIGRSWGTRFDGRRTVVRSDKVNPRARGTTCSFGREERPGPVRADEGGRGSLHLRADAAGGGPCCGLAVATQDAGERGRIERMAASRVKVTVLRRCIGDPDRMKFSARAGEGGRMKAISVPAGEAPSRRVLRAYAPFLLGAVGGAFAPCG